MKTLFVSIFILSSCFVYGQKKTVVDVIQNEVVEMLGTSIIKPGSLSRGAVSLIHFPNNTAYIIYTVQAYKANEEIIKIPSLASAITAAMTGNVPVSKALALAKLPKSKMAVDLFLLPATIETQQFLNNSDGHWTDYKSYARPKCTNCRVMAEWPLPGCTHAYVGIRNGSTSENIKVVVNVAAVVIE